MSDDIQQMNSDFGDYWRFHNLEDGSVTGNFADDQQLAFQAGWRAAQKHVGACVIAPRFIKATSGGEYQAVCVQYACGYNGDGFGWTHFMHVPLQSAEGEA